MSDIVERLRASICGDKCRCMEAKLGCECAEAADTIEALRAERDDLKEDRDLWKHSEAACSTQFDKLQKENSDLRAERDALREVLENAVDTTPTGTLNLPKWQYLTRVYAACLRATGQTITDEARVTIADHMGVLEKAIAALTGDTQ